jgi:hypothetical protein
MNTPPSPSGVQRNAGRAADEGYPDRCLNRAMVSSRSSLLWLRAGRSTSSNKDARPDATLDRVSRDRPPPPRFRLSAGPSRN